MPESGGVRIARTIVLVVLTSFAAVYALAAPSRVSEGWRALLAVLLIAVVTVLQYGWVLPRLRRFRDLRWTMVEIVAAYAAVAGCGVSAALLGFPAGALLLRGRWRPAVLVIVGGTAITVARSGPGFTAADVTISEVLLALVGYGLIRLAQLADEMAAARLTLATSAAAEERLRIAAELGTGLGDGLAAIARVEPTEASIDETLRVARAALATTRHAAVEFRSLSLAPEAATARALLVAAGIEAEVRIGHSEPLGPAGALLTTVLREAVTEVVRQGTAHRCTVETAERDGLVVLRVGNDGVRTVERGAEGLDTVTEQVEAAGGRLTTDLDESGLFVVEAAVRATRQPVVPPDRTGYRLSVGLLAVVLAGFCAKALLQLRPGPEQALALLPLVAVGAVQLRWAMSPSGGRWWRLLGQAVLCYLPLLWFGKAWGGVTGLLNGSLLVALPPALAWPLVAAVMASAAGAAALAGEGAPVIVNSAVSVLVTGLVVYGLVRLARLVEELRDAGAALARAAVVQERLRAARDLHDLLGHSLAAVLLKCELARRLMAVHPDRAKAELTDVAGMAEQALVDLRTVTGTDPAMSLTAELESARAILTAADVEVAMDTALQAAAGAEVETVLSTVLREAVTNVLRHTSAEHVRIVLAPAEQGVRLEVANDGLDPDAPVEPPGAGLGNLTTRLAALDGTLTIRRAGGRFTLVAEVPDPV